MGYVPDALPYNYTDVPPTDLSIVIANLTLLKEIIRGEKEGGENNEGGDQGKEGGGECGGEDEDSQAEKKRALRALIRSITHTVYEVVSLLVSDMSLLVTDDFDWGVARRGVRERGGEGSGGGEKEGVRRDLEYLVEMKGMDEEIEKGWEEEEAGRGGGGGAKKLEMTAVVPISGLVMGRLLLLFYDYYYHFYFYYSYYFC